MGEIKQVKESPLVLNSSEIEFREYQISIAEKCIHENSLVVLPTGLGKTIIGVLVSRRILELFPPQSKIVILAPTRPLINQHYETFIKFLTIPKERFKMLTGKISPEKRAGIFSRSQILFYTPQTLRNDLVNEKYTLKNTALIIFDEAHHASGDYPYTMIADTFTDQSPDGVILALTASPGSSKERINQLCVNLHIPVKNIHIRTRRDKDVKTYLKPMDIYKIGVNLTELMDQIYCVITAILEERLQYLSQLNFLDEKSEVLHTKIIRKDLLKLNSELVSLLKRNGDKTDIYSALSINAQALILYHMLELIEQQGLNVLLIYLQKLHKDAMKKDSSKAVKILASDYRIHQIWIELQKHNDFTPEKLIHPKYHVLVQILLNELQHNPTSHILVFVKLRDSVRNLVHMLNEIDKIRSIRFVGQATKSSEDKGLSQKNQIEILNKFKDGEYNVLVATNVGEEGLDIAECDLVVFYDVVASEIRLIQRKGRTARHRKGTVVILYCKGTHDEIYLKIALSKLKRMNITLKDPQQLKASYNNKILARNSEKIEQHSQLIKKDKKSTNRTKKKQHQTQLSSFLDMHPDNDIPPIHSSFIKISKLLPLKYGLRKKFQHDNIEFEIVESDLHIVIFNKVLIQIYYPKSIDNLTDYVNDLSQIYSLFIMAFDFTNFEENFAGEKQLLKRDIHNFFKQSQNSNPIFIDNEEELYFIVKSIYENAKNKE